MAYTRKRPARYMREDVDYFEDEVSSPVPIRNFRLPPLSICFEALRPRQWIKNTLLFAALFFAIWDPAQLPLAHIYQACLTTTIAFIAFCILSSSVYLLNDLHDLDDDRRHRLKKERPLASGRLSTRAGYVLAMTMGIGAIVLSASTASLNFCFAVGGYFVLQLVYTGWLKRYHRVDIFVLAAGFVLRVLAGGWVIDVRISSWLMICVFMMALFVALCKRRWDACDSADAQSTPPIPKGTVSSSHIRRHVSAPVVVPGRRVAVPISRGSVAMPTAVASSAPFVPKNLSRRVIPSIPSSPLQTGKGAPAPKVVENPAAIQFLTDIEIGVIATSMIMCYTMYTLSSETIVRYGTEWLVLTVPLVVFGTFRYLYLVYVRELGGQPEKMFTDRILLATVLLWGGACAAILQVASLKF